MHIRKPLPLLAVISTLLALICLGVFAALWYRYRTDFSRFSEVLLTISGILVLVGVLALWQWKIYSGRLKLYRRWASAKHELAQMILNLDAFEVTFETVPDQMREGELRFTWGSLKNLTLSLMKYQDTVENLSLGSSAFVEELENFEDSLRRAQALGSGLMGSGSFWSGSQSDRTVFDILLRPISPLIREMLFYLEDIPSQYYSESWAPKLRAAYGSLIDISEDAAEQSSHRKLSFEQLEELVERWQKAESNLIASTGKLLISLNNLAIDFPEILTAPSSEPDSLNQLVLRRALGLPTQKSQVPEFGLEKLTRAGYQSADRSWRAEILWPQPRQRQSISYLRALKEHRKAVLEDSLVFKAETIFSRLDREIENQHVVESRWSKRILIGALVLGGFLGFLCLPLLSDTYFESELGKWAYVACSFLGLILSPLLIAYLFIALLWVHRKLLSGEFTHAKNLRMLARKLREELNSLSLDIDNAQLTHLVAASSSSLETIGFSHRLYERAFAYALRDAEEIESLSRFELASPGGEQQLEKLAREVAYLQEYREDLELAGKSS